MDIVLLHWAVFVCGEDSFCNFDDAVGLRNTTWTLFRSTGHSSSVVRTASATLMMFVTQRPLAPSLPLSVSVYVFIGCFTGGWLNKEVSEAINGDAVRDGDREGS